MHKCEWNNPILFCALPMVANVFRLVSHIEPQHEQGNSNYPVLLKFSELEQTRKINANVGFVRYIPFLA